jgi:hypothetical protein
MLEVLTVSWDSIVHNLAIIIILKKCAASIFRVEE